MLAIWGKYSARSRPARADLGRLQHPAGPARPLHPRPSALASGVEQVARRATIVTDQ